jgi:hypothetical protein
MKAATARAGWVNDGNEAPEGSICPDLREPCQTLLFAQTNKGSCLVHCLVANDYHYPHVTRADYNLICCHPEKEAIIARTKAEPAG